MTLGELQARVNELVMEHGTDVPVMGYQAEFGAAFDIAPEDVTFCTVQDSEFGWEPVQSGSERKDAVVIPYSKTLFSRCLERIKAEKRLHNSERRVTRSADTGPSSP